MDIPNRATRNPSGTDSPDDGGAWSLTEILVATWLTALMVVALLAIAWVPIDEAAAGVPIEDSPYVPII